MALRVSLFRTLALFAMGFDLGHVAFGPITDGEEEGCEVAAEGG